MGEKVEANMPGGFLLLIIDRITNTIQPGNDVVDANGMISIDYIQEKVWELSEKGVFTYCFNKDTKVPQIEFCEDLVTFAKIGWLEIEGKLVSCKLTPKGIRLVRDLILPECVEDKFQSLFEHQSHVMII